MKLLLTKAFLELSDAEVAAFAQSDAGLQIPPACLPNVIDNLQILHRHALIVAAALPADAAQAAPEAFAP